MDGVAPVVMPVVLEDDHIEGHNDGLEGVPPQAVVYHCPGECNFETIDIGRYITHLNVKHSECDDLASFYLPSVTDLRRCAHCRRICRNDRGVQRHQSQNQQCKAIRGIPAAIGLVAHGGVGAPAHPPIAAEGGNGGQVNAGVADGAELSLNDPPPPYIVDGGGTPVVPPPAPVHGTGGDDLAFLVSAFNTGMYTVQRKWKRRMNILSLRLLNAISVCGISTEENDLTAGFLLLPGLVNEARLHKKMSPEKVLTRFAACNSSSPVLALAQDIIALAREWVPIVMERRDRRRESAGRRAPSQDTVCLRLESLVREGRLASAMAQLDKLQDILEVQAGDLVEVRSGPELEEVQALIASLNPSSDQYDQFTADQLREAGASSPLEVSSLDVIHTMKNLPVGSASGASGWTYATLKTLFFEADNADEACDVIARFCNRMIAGRITSPLWLRSRAVLIPKKGLGWRPLGIGETWYRFVARCAVGTGGEAVGRQLLPLQLGCGVRGGCEIAGRLGQIILDADQDLVIISLDMKNAFGTIPRELMLRGVLRFIPGLAKWFMWAYGTSSPLISSDGQVVGKSSTGCRQGDPLAALCFCVGMQFVLEEIQTLMQDKMQQMILPVGSSLVGVGLFAYMDDTNLYVPKLLANLVIEGLAEIYGRYRLILNQDKCRLLGRAAADIVGPLFVVEPEGLVLMGAPTGNGDYRRGRAEHTVDKATSSMTALQHIELWSAWSLLRHCIIARVGYLARVLEYDYCFDALERFDNKVDDAVFRMAGPDVRSSPLYKARVKCLRSLPLALGGLGLTRYAGLAGEQACLLSRSLTYNFLEKYCPILALGVMGAWRPITLGSSEDQYLRDEVGMSGGTGQGGEQVSLVLSSGEIRFDPDAWDTNLPYEERRALRRLTCHADEDLGQSQAAPAFTVHEEQVSVKTARSEVRAIHERRCYDLCQSLLDQGLVSESTWLKESCFKGSGQWLAGPGGIFYGHYAFRSKAEYRAALRMRFLLPPASPDVVRDGAVALCRCREPEVGVRAGTWLHPIDCSAGQWHFIERHNRVRDLLWDFMKVHAAAEYRILREPRVQSPADPLVSPSQLNDHLPAQQAGAMSVTAYRAQRAAEGVALRADIGRFSALKRQYIDVAVVNPSAASYQHETEGSTATAAAAVVPVVGLGVTEDGGNGIGNGGNRGRMGQQNMESRAVREREMAKRAKYRRVLNVGVDDVESFVPFVVEATGRISNLGHRFLSSVAENFPRADRLAKSRLVWQIGAVIARYNAMLVLAWSRHITAQQ